MQSIDKGPSNGWGAQETSDGGHLAAFRRVHRDDVLQYLAANTLVSSSLGSQLEALRTDAFAEQSMSEKCARLELKMMRDVAIIRCVDALDQYVSIRFADVECLRRFAARCRTRDGHMVVATIRAFQGWSSKSSERGLAEVFSLMRRKCPTFAQVEFGEEETAQAFREGKANRARIQAARLLADAEIALASWIERWNRRWSREGLLRGGQ
jgi:hypothetical protein